VSAFHRREVVRALLRERGELLCVTGLGASAWDVASCSNDPLDFPLWGAMGGAAMVGLGLALAQPDRTVLVLTGDGEMLMGLGSLATIGAQRPANLRLVVLDNGLYSETGCQRTHTAMGVDLAEVARGCGFPHVRTVKEQAELEAVRADLYASVGLRFSVVKVLYEELPRTMPPRDGAYLTHRMREALLGVEKALEG
jgi:thiamine pyrophosphate-dependent acetolactate synthase large subunit-like protein